MLCIYIVGFTVTGSFNLYYYYYYFASPSYPNKYIIIAYLYTCREEEEDEEEEQQFHFSLRDFKCVAVLGRGHFGKVNLIRSSQPSVCLCSAVW